jgi:small subunit ribosomal protein S17
MSTPETTESRPKTVKTRTGIVLKNKMQKTVVVEVTRRYQHNKYAKMLKSRERYKAHDPENKCNVGDMVIIEETRPMSKTKRWRVKEITQQATGV